MSEYRAGELAEAAGISVALLRSYQSKGLLPPPRHSGRVALYGHPHLDRLRQIEAFKARGHSLRSIAEHFEAPSGFRPSVSSDEEHFRLREIATRSGVPIEMLRSLEASGLLAPRIDDTGPYYTEADVRAVECVLLLIGSGIPFDRFLEVAQPQIETGEQVAQGAIGVFERFVVPRLPAAPSPARREALAAMAAAIGDLAGYLLERQVLAADAPPRRVDAEG